MCVLEFVEVVQYVFNAIKAQDRIINSVFGIQWRELDHLCRSLFDESSLRTLAKKDPNR